MMRQNKQLPPVFPEDIYDTCEQLQELRLSRPAIDLTCIGGLCLADGSVQAGVLKALGTGFWHTTTYYGTSVARGAAVQTGTRTGYWTYVRPDRVVHAHRLTQHLVVDGQSLGTPREVWKVANDEVLTGDDATSAFLHVTQQIDTLYAQELMGKRTA
jgi:hypothetical protein